MSEGTQVKMDMGAHGILVKRRAELKELGVKVPLGTVIREMNKIIKNKDLKWNFNQKQIKVLKDAVQILRNYNDPTLSDVIKNMDVIIDHMEA